MNLLYQKGYFTIIISLLLGFKCLAQPIIISDTVEQNPLLIDPTEIHDPLFFIEGQLCQHLRKIFQDSEGNLWFGTNVYGLIKYDGAELTYLDKEEGFSSGRVTEILENSEGNLWIATGFGLNKYDGNSFTIFTEKDGLSNAEIWSLLLDSKGQLWIGHNEGLSLFDGKNFKEIPIPKPQDTKADYIYSPNRITAIVEHSDGSLYLGTDGYGICKYHNGSFSYLNEENGLPNNAICELMVDRQDNLWIGTFWGGLSKFDGKQFTNYTKDGLIEGNEVGAFFEDQNGDIWFGVENNGVYKYDGNTFHHFYKKEGLNGSILSIYRDRAERFWFGGWGGLFSYDGNSFSSIPRKSFQK